MKSSNKNISISYAVCMVPVASVRREPDHHSELVSQLLFGECCLVVGAETNGWIPIQNKLDGYGGWCSGLHVREVDEVYYNTDNISLAADWVNEIRYNGQIMMVPFGSLLRDVEAKNSWIPANAKKDADTIREVAFKFLNSSYLWGGKSVFGVDCSGFTQSVFRFLNIPLLRNAHYQVTQGVEVGFLQEARCGDLAFFDDAEERIIHVGILLSQNEIIHASGKVRIDKIDNEGIVNADTGQRTQQLRIIKRLI